jgi:hypothetical protein
MGKQSGIKVIKNNQGEIIVTTQAAYLSGAKAAITFSNDYFYEDKSVSAKPFPSEKKKELKYIPWGDDNLYPQNVVVITEKNPVALNLIDFKMQLSYGSGVKLGYYDLEGELKEYTPLEIEKNAGLKKVQTWIDDNNLNSELAEICMDEAWWDQADVEIILNRDKDAIAQINSKDKVFSRYSEMNKDGKIETHLYSAKWDANPTDDDTIFTPCLDFKKPGLDLKMKMGLTENEDGVKENNAEARYIYPIRHSSPGRKYYPFPTWHSIITSGWMDFANAIPVFKKAMMTNSITVKYHIEINMDYFPRVFSELGLSKKADCEAYKNNDIKQSKIF